MSSRGSIVLVVTLAGLLLPPGAAAADWWVAEGASGDGSPGAPFGTVQQALDAAGAGDTIHVGPGTYQESIASRRDGEAGAPITVRAEPGTTAVLTASGRVVRIGHAHLHLEGLIIDGQYGDRDAVDVEDSADFLQLRGCEVRRSGRDCIDMGSPEGVLIEGCLVHHCLNWDPEQGGRVDAHGIVGGAVRDLVIRNTEVHTFSGDAVQVDPGRAEPGWDRLRIEGCRFWLQPMPHDENGFAAGTVPGENALDTKTWPDGPRAVVTITDTVAHGFRGGLIGNMAAFNLKEKIEARLDRVTVYDSEIALRLRGPGARGGAWVTVTNAVLYDLDTAVRYEDDIERVELYNCTFGRAIGAFFDEASADNAGLDVRNNLLLAGALPAEAPKAANLATDDAGFVDAAGHDYHLLPGSPAVDEGESIAAVTDDRDGVTRPQGEAYDLGAYELVQDTPDGGQPDADAGETDGQAHADLPADQGVPADEGADRPADAGDNPDASIQDDGARDAGGRAGGGIGGSCGCGADGSRACWSSGCILILVLGKARRRGRSGP